MNVLQRIFAFAVDKNDWVRMNRPMARPYDPVEGKERRSEYSKLLESLAYSELQGRCDPEDATGYPVQILKWQFGEGLLIGATSTVKSSLTTRLSPKDPQMVAEKQCEYARRLAFFIVAQEAKTPVEYLHKICRNWDPKPPNQDFGIDLPDEEW